MKYTKEQLQAMSDFEVNQYLFEELIPANCFSYEAEKRPDSDAVYWSTAEAQHSADYCNTPNDIMPLAFEYAIGVEVNPIRTEWLARTCDISMSSMSFICYIDKNPLRAISCCLILVLQGNEE